MKKGLFLFSITLALASESILADVNVNCNSGQSINAAILSASAGDIINISGACRESVLIDKDGITLQGDANSSIQPMFFGSAITIDGATRISVNNLTLQNGFAGVATKANASVSLRNITASNNVFGIFLQSGSHISSTDVNIKNSGAIGVHAEEGSKLELLGNMDISSSAVFGLNFQTNSSLRVVGTQLKTHANLLGGQITTGSSLFVDEGEIIVEGNHTIGFSINTGASGFLFNAKLYSNRNGLDGFDIVSNANFDIDGSSSLISENNGRDGISIDDGTLNSFGFFVGENPGPLIAANTNARDGLRIEFSGKLDVGVNSRLEAKNNLALGLNIDNASVVQLRDSDINGNNGSFIKSRHRKNNHDEVIEDIDLLATFGSRISFIKNNSIGKAICAQHSISRGDVRCRD
ncbi:MAG: hypothetical protein OEZ58_01225 [Gammaproteobacteria bacterium]|nr:hypothetical protein [Gammaproteobacteria bacterium]